MRRLIKRIEYCFFVLTCVCVITNSLNAFDSIASKNNFTKTINFNYSSNNSIPYDSEDDSCEWKENSISEKIEELKRIFDQEGFNQVNHLVLFDKSSNNKNTNYSSIISPEHSDGYSAFLVQRQLR